MDTYGALNQMFQELGRAVGDFDAQQTVTAADAITHFQQPGGDVVLLNDDEFQITHKPISEVKSWDDPWPTTYGLDGSTTRALQFNNGLLAAGSAAKLGVSGETSNADLANRTTTTLVAHHNDDEFELPGVGESDIELPEGTDAEMLRFPASDLISRLDDYLVGVSRTYAEGKHARKYAAELDGPLFIDGPLYPNPAFSWMLFEQAGVGPTYMTDNWPEMVGEILQNYVSTVEIMYDRNYPPIGIIKTGRSSAALDSLQTKIEDNDVDIETPLPWGSDHLLFDDALYNPDDRYGNKGPIISYTPWFLQKKEGAHDESVVPFEFYDGVSLKWGDAEEYIRAFFYVRCPQSDYVMRVETPHTFARNARLRERITRKALVEIAQQQKEPRAITFADQLARISRDDRFNLRDVIEQFARTNHGDVRAVQDYNEGREFDRFEEY